MFIPAALGPDLPGSRASVAIVNDRWYYSIDEAQATPIIGPPAGRLIQAERVITNIPPIIIDRPIMYDLLMGSLKKKKLNAGTITKLRAI